MNSPNLALADEALPLEPDGYVVPGYRVRRHICRGRRYDLYEVWSEERRCSCVVKTPRPARERDQQVLASLRQEGELLLSLAHPHLVRAYELVDGPRLAIVLETLGGQSLKQLIHSRGRPLTVQELACLALHVCSSIAYLHGKGLLHLDLRPSTIGSDFGRAKIVDLSRVRPPGPGHSGLGTPAYLAPEQALGTQLTTTTDVWGVGVVLYEAVTGQVPFPGSGPGDYQQLTLRLKLPREHRTRLPVELTRVIEACLEQAAQARPFPTEVEALCVRIA